MLARGSKPGLRVNGCKSNSNMNFCKLSHEIIVRTVVHETWMLMVIWVNPADSGTYKVGICDD